MTYKINITQEQLKSILSYDRMTGEFIWKMRVPESFRENADRSRDKSCASWNTRYGNKPAGSLNKEGYIEIAIDGTRYRAHILAWLCEYGELPSMGIDHIDGNRVNNSISNLRLATASQNAANGKKPITNNTGYKGVHIAEHAGKFRAMIKVNKKHIHLGYFVDPKAAHDAYIKAAIKYFGEFARTE